MPAWLDPSWRQSCPRQAELDLAVCPPQAELEVPLATCPPQAELDLTVCPPQAELDVAVAEPFCQPHWMVEMVVVLSLPAGAMNRDASSQPGRQGR